MRANGYGSYRGRNRFRTFLKVLIVLLLILLILMVAAFFVLERYMVITPDGYRLQLPFLQQEATPSPAPDPTPDATLPLVLATPTPTPAPEALHAVLLPRAALYDGTAASLVEQAGGNAAMFDMKADDGSLAYITSLPLAVSSKVSAADPAINAAIQGLNSSGLYTVARISCFRDNAVPYRNNATAIRTSAGNWRDGDGVRWLSPASQEARDYLAGICAELAGLGFDEILLDFCTYPTNGRLTTIKRNAAYDEAALDQPLDQFYAQVRQALADYPEVKLSLVAAPGLISGNPEDKSGQTIGHLTQYADRVWISPVDGEFPQDVQVLADAGLEPWQLVYLGGIRSGGTEGWATTSE